MDVGGGGSLAISVCSVRRRRAAKSAAAFSRARLKRQPITTRTNASTQHHLRMTPEEPRGKGGNAAVSVLRYSQVFHYTSLVLSQCRAVEFTPHPFHLPSCTQVAPAFANPTLPLLLLLFPLDIHTPYLAEHSSSLAPAVSWISFLSQHILELCVVCVSTVCACMRVSVSAEVKEMPSLWLLTSLC